jgi:hypothetical protein
VGHYACQRLALINTLPEMWVKMVVMTKNNATKWRPTMLGLVQAYKNFLKYRINEPQITLTWHRFTCYADSGID